MAVRASKASRLDQLRQRWWFPVATGIVGILLGAIPDWYPLLRELLTAPYAGSQMSYWSQPGRYRLIRCTGPTRFAAEDISMAVYVRVTNTSQIPRQIQGYRVEMRHEAAWQPLGRAPVLGEGPMYVELTPEGKKPTGYVDATAVAFDRKLSEPLEPGESTEGWMFLRRPADSTLQTGGPRQFRVLLHDTRGDRVTIALAPPSEDQVWNQMSFGLLPKGSVPSCMTTPDADGSR